jgi:hypothetical protein
MMFSWTDALVPWDPLDEEGEEDVFEDTVSLRHFYMFYIVTEILPSFTGFGLGLIIWHL